MCTELSLPFGFPNDHMEWNLFRLLNLVAVCVAGLYAILINTSKRFMLLKTYLKTIDYHSNSENSEKHFSVLILKCTSAEWISGATQPAIASSFILKGWLSQSSFC